MVIISSIEELVVIVIMATVVALAVVVEISSVEVGLLLWCGFIGNDISDR